MLQYVAVCCSVLQCIAVCCSTLQCEIMGDAFAMRYVGMSVLHCVAALICSCVGVECVAVRCVNVLQCSGM